MNIQRRKIIKGFSGNRSSTHSGDCAKIDDDGFMCITGRIKELIITAGGENIPPVLIEEKIKENCTLDTLVYNIKQNVFK